MLWISSCVSLMRTTMLVRNIQLNNLAISSFLWNFKLVLSILSQLQLKNIMCRLFWNGFNSTEIFFKLIEFLFIQFIKLPVRCINMKSAKRYLNYDYFPKNDFCLYVKFNVTHTFFQYFFMGVQSTSSTAGSMQKYVFISAVHMEQLMTLSKQAGQ